MKDMSQFVLRLVGTIALLFAFALPMAVAQEPPVRVRGTIDRVEGDIYVVKHPFFAVTDDKGSFTIKGLPAGTYTVEAIHEKLGSKTGTATVAENGKATVTFNFGG